MFEEEDIRENIITYDDEGGGEEDTEAFDIATLQVRMSHYFSNRPQKEGLHHLSGNVCILVNASASLK